MKKSRAEVSNAAVIQYLQLVCGVDIEGLRRRIGRKVDTGIDLEADGVYTGGYRYRLNGNRVIGVFPHNKPPKGKRAVQKLRRKNRARK